MGKGEGIHLSHVREWELSNCLSKQYKRKQGGGDCRSLLVRDGEEVD